MQPNTCIDEIMELLETVLHDLSESLLDRYESVDIRVVIDAH
ncbi:hypothetical protein [Alicyclobacillus dauci]|uniref:Uncharacterized protein n=1 Tax=Alicyclobacillus dauci TaxID=1475485 RepID=A0ABY6Z8J8_9BACL|nr:hypothetical protein [Alicyclobacillus dauci]WAH38579.1 hypothetical protein NZD86_08905 [Alicyclobacillus dauci]